MIFNILYNPLIFIYYHDIVSSNSPRPILITVHNNVYRVYHYIYPFFLSLIITLSLSTILNIEMSEFNERIESLERLRKELASKRENLEKSYKAHSEFDQQTYVVKKK